MKNIVYGLTDSRNDLVYYVGKSSVGKNRPIQHLLNSHSEGVNNWREEVESNWGKVKVILIEEVDDLLLLHEREKFWIGYYSELNPNLLNKKDFPVFVDVYSEDDDELFNDLQKCIGSLPDIINRRRLALNATQDNLAKLAGINRYTVGQIESGRSITTKVLNQIILALKAMEIDKLIIDQNIKDRASNVDGKY